ncbi:homeobox protein 2-like [Leptopilina heterotoma]|uniref:homeobox protein 2-like n=1 Tax=Leptopilina heterotoma TaxID=63436 RepID=UPI001CAA40E9|nr:homeobox protein 2-like [Leptopilina heterotoma]
MEKQADYENQYYCQTENKQFNEYEQVTPNSYKQPWNNQRRKRNQRQSQRFNSRIYSNNGINNQNINMNFRKNYQTMTSQGYEKGNFYNSDRNFEEYNIDSRNLQYRFAEEEQEFNVRNEYRRYNDIQDDYRIERQKDYEYTNYEESIHDYDFVTPPIRFKDSSTNQNSLKDEKQSDYNVSPSVNEPQLETESERSSEEEENISIININNTKNLKEERTQEQLRSKNEEGRKLEEFRDATINQNAKHPIEMSHKDENPARNMTISSVTSVNQEILEEIQTLNRKSVNFVSIIQDYSEEKQLLIINEDNETENVPDGFTIEMKSNKLDTESNEKMTTLNSATQQNLRLPGSMSFGLLGHHM